MAKYKKRKDGRYATTVSFGYGENGKRLTKTLYGRTISELDTKIACMKTELAKGTYCFTGDSTFKTYAKSWLEVSKANRGIRTQEMYQGILKNHTSLLDEKPLREITPSDIQRCINSAAEHPRTAQQLLITLRQVVKAAQNDGILYRDPTIGAELPRMVKKERRALTKAEKQAIREAELDLIERAFVDVLYCTGMRPAEMFALTWSDIDFKNEEIKITKSLTFSSDGSPTVSYPKTNAGIRTIQAHRIAIESLKAYKRTSNSLVVFGGSNGQYMSKHQYSTIWEHCKKKIEEKLGHRTDITMYYFRHNFCTELYYSDISLKEAQRLMGHSDATMIIKVYSHLDAEKENTKSKIQAINF